MRTLTALIAFALTALIGVTPAAAGDFQVNPVRLFPENGARTGMLTLTNRGTTPVRLQLSGFSWSELARGEPSLTPTDALVVFPSLLELGPGQSRRVRVGVNGQGQDREETYRIIVEELPDHRSVNAQGVNIRMRMSVPIFVDPRGTSARGELDGVRMETAAGRQLIFTLKNLGNQHFKAEAITVGLDVKGRKEPLLTQFTGWYVLAGGVREHVVALPPEARCVTGATIGVETDFAGRLERVMPVTDPACSR